MGGQEGQGEGIPGRVPALPEELPESLARAGLKPFVESTTDVGARSDDAASTAADGSEADIAESTAVDGSEADSAASTAADEPTAPAPDTASEGVMMLELPARWTIP